MSLVLSVSPNFPAAQLSGWFMLNTYLQKKMGINIQLKLYDDIDSQRQALRKGEIDLIYANPYDASLVVRDLCFKAICKPVDSTDEVVIVSKSDSAYKTISDLTPGISIATTNDPTINMIANIMLEVADVTPENTRTNICDSFVIAAKQIIKGSAQIATLNKRDYDSLSNLIKEQLNPIVTSQISLIHHIFAAGEKAYEYLDSLEYALIELSATESGRVIVNGLGLTGFKSLHEEDTEFMIDLMDTLDV